MYKNIINFFFHFIIQNVRMNSVRKKKKKNGWAARTGAELRIFV